MPAYKVSEAAFNDLIDIGAYTEQEWGISQRDNYLNDIEARFKTLASNTEHPTVKDRSEIRKECFSSSINEHIIIFRKTKYGVRILRVLYKKWILFATFDWLVPSKTSHSRYIHNFI